MNLTNRKPKLVLIALIMVIAMLCGMLSLAPMSAVRAEEQDNTTVESNWFEVTYSKDDLAIRLSNDYRKYLEESKGDLTSFKNALVAAVKEIVMNGILNVQTEGKAEAAAYSTILPFAAPNDFPSDLPPEFQGGDIGAIDWNNSELLNSFKDYVEERLSDPVELDKYLDGEYNVLLEYAIGEYVQHKQSEGDVEEDEIYKDIKDAIQGVVDTAMYNALDTLAERAVKEQLESEGKDIKDLAPGELDTLKQNWKDTDEKAQEYKKDWAEQSQEVLTQTADVVKENGGKAPSLGVSDIIDALDSVYVNDTQLFSRGSGIYVKNLRQLLSIIPRPAEIADMSAEDLKDLISANIKLETKFGDIKFKLTFGFIGDSHAIQSAAKFIADHIDVKVDGNKYAVAINVPDAFGKVLSKFYKSNRFSDTTKNNVFAFFGKTLSEIEDKFVGFTYEEVLDFFKGIDYQKWFNDLLNGDFITTYFGNYFERVFGEPLTDEVINKIIDSFSEKMADFASRELTYKDAYDFLAKNIPGFGRLAGSLDNERLEALVNKLLNIINNVDWEKYDAQGVRDVLASSETFNDTIVSYIEKFEGYGDVYETFIGYVEKAFGYLPENIRNGAIIDMYDGEGAYSHNGTYTLDFEKIFGKIASVFRNHGFDQLADLADNAVKALDETTYTFDLSFNMNVNNVYKVEYFVGNEEQNELTREGLLPFGANVDLFARPEEVVEGKYDILYWMNANKDKVTEMPEADTALYAVTDFTLDGFIDEEQFDEKYAVLMTTSTPGLKHELKVVPDGVSYAEYEYAWSHDGKAIEGANSNTYMVGNVADSGMYTVVVTDKFTGHQAEFTFEVEIEQGRSIEVSAKLVPVTKGYKQGNKISYEYDGSEKTVAWEISYKWVEENKELTEAEIADLTKCVVIEENNMSRIDARQNIVSKLAISVADDYIEKVWLYVDGELCEDNVAEIEDTWTIEKAKISVKYVWDYDASVARPQTGEEYTVKVKEVIITAPDRFVDTTAGLFDIDRIVYSGDSNVQTLSGTYHTTASAALALRSLNYEIVAEENATLEWSIDKAQIADPANKWNTLGFFGTFTYSLKVGEFDENNIKYTGLPVGYEEYFEVSAFTYTKDGQVVDKSELLQEGSFKVNVTVTFIENDVCELKSGKTEFKFTANINVSKTSVSLYGAVWYFDGKEYEGEDIFYDGNKKEFELRSQNGNVLGDAIREKIEYVYYRSGSTEELGDAPSEVGNYKVSVRLKAEYREDHKLGTPPEDLEFEIKSGETIDLGDAKWYLGSSEYKDEAIVYDGTAKALVLGGLDTSILEKLTYTYYNVVDGTRGDVIEAPINAGVYEVVVSAEGLNVINPPDAKRYEIKPAAIDAKPSATLSATEVLPDEDGKWTVTVTYGTENEHYTYATRADSVLEAEEAGEYKVYVTATISDKNYTFIGLTAGANEQISEDGLTFTITLTWTAKEGGELPPVGEDLDLTGAVWNANGEAYDGSNFSYTGRTVSFTLSGVASNILAQLEYVYYKDGSETGSKDLPFEAGSYVVKVVAKTGYKLVGEFDETVEFVIDKAVLVNPSAKFDRNTDIVRGKEVITVTPSSSNFYSEGVITGDTEAGVIGKYTITITFTLTDQNFMFDADDLDNDQYTCAIIEDGQKFVITYNWELKENVERSFNNAATGVTVTDENNTLPESITENELKVSMEQVDLGDYTDELKAQYPDKKAKFGSAYDIRFEVDGKKFETAAGSKFRVRIPVPQNLIDYAKEDLVVMHIKDDGSIEYLPVINLEVVNSPDKDGVTTSVKYADFEVDGFSMFVLIGLEKIPGSVGSWWLILLLCVLGVLVIAAIVFLVLRLRKKNDDGEAKAAEIEGGEGSEEKESSDENNSDDNDGDDNKDSDNKENE